MGFGGFFRVSRLKLALTACFLCLILFFDLVYTGGNSVVDFVQQAVYYPVFMPAMFVAEHAALLSLEAGGVPLKVTESVACPTSLVGLAEGSARIECVHITNTGRVFIYGFAVLWAYTLSSIIQGLHDFIYMKMHSPTASVQEAA